MSLAMARSDGVTVLTLNSDPSSVCPPLCQLLGALCYSPALCSVSHHLLPRRGGPQAALGALWIITGVLHIGLGVILITNRDAPVYSLRDTYCPVWLGVLFVLFGVSCVLTERYPRPILVLLNGLLNLIGAALSITAIVWYSTDVQHSRYGFYYDYVFEDPGTPSPVLNDRLDRYDAFISALRVLTISILAVLITLSTLDLCLGISSATLSFKTLKDRLNKSGNKPLLKEDKATTE